MKKHAHSFALVLSFFPPLVRMNQINQNCFGINTKFVSHSSSQFISVHLKVNMWLEYSAISDQSDDIALCPGTGCELYAFCGALFGICSMITLMVIAVDRYFVITRPLSSIGMLSEKRALLVLTFAWVYSLGWSLPPFFGWSEYSKGGIEVLMEWDFYKHAVVLL